eukprot:TRINITY_DN60673_c0_g1_i1.p1 TRINITY_DN60673_c0_g1~~TRINITY_DN60673_c0_g1_i1.p1  ORF type:complete len:211 (+),score=12.83 TRINITY_DN60673_c0_g1_i1:154-786(+)
MHNLQTRLGNVFSFFLSVLMALSLIIGLTSHFMLPEYPSHTGIFKLQNAAFHQHSEHLRYALRDHNGPVAPYIMLTFDMELDLAKLFHYNTKQVFLFVTVEYGGKSYPRNEITIWDKIIMAEDTSPGFRSVDKQALKAAQETGGKERYLIKLEGQRNKYALNHVVPKLSDKVMDQEVKIKARYYTTPYVGFTRLRTMDMFTGKLGDFVKK